jgi:hypothetical protein
VVLKCGATTNEAEDGKEFTSKQFCRVAYMPNITGSGYTAPAVPNLFPTKGKYYASTVQNPNVATGSQANSVNAIPAGAVVELCGTEYEGKLEVNSEGEILTLTGGEYYAIRSAGDLTADVLSFGADAGFKYPIVNSKYSLGYYANGNQRCSSNNEVQTKCKKGTTVDETWFNAKTSFCHETKAGSGTGNDTLFIKPLCLKTGAKELSDAPQYDNIAYFCNEATGRGERRCGGGYYDENKRFCWGNATTGTVGDICAGAPGSTGTAATGATEITDINSPNFGKFPSEANNVYNYAAYDPSKNACGYLPDVKQSASEGNKYNASLAQQGYKHVALPTCGTTKINENSWNWEFCTNGTIAYCEGTAPAVPNPTNPSQCKKCGQATGEKTGNDAAVVILNDGTGACLCNEGYVITSTGACGTCAASESIVGKKCVTKCAAGQLHFSETDPTCIVLSDCINKSSSATDGSAWCED